MDVTKGDPGVVGWSFTDRVTRLRWIGTERAIKLEQARYVVGSGPDATLLLDDPSVSRRHAELVATDDGWLITDLGSTNGIRRDGEQVKSFVIMPAMEVSLSRGATFIAESPMLSLLTAALQRFLGWSPSAFAAVDNALHAVRQMAHLRSILVLRGEGDLGGIARKLHDLALGPSRPFSIHEAPESGMAALQRAKDGTLFLDGEELPSDIETVVVSLRHAENRTRLVVRITSDDAMAEVAALSPHIALVRVPSLSDRGAELDAVLLAYADDAVMRSGAPSANLRPHDIRWIREGGVPTHARAEEVMRRVVYERNFGVKGGAAREGITPGAMTRYLQRAGIPT